MENENSAVKTLAALEALAANLDDERMEIAKSVTDWIGKSKQKPQYRCIYDVRRWHYTRYLELILEEKGIARLIKIIDGREDASAQKAIDKLHDITKGKPATKVEVSGYVTQGEVQKAVEAQTLQPDGEWVNPEHALEPERQEVSEKSQEEE
jgi:hypothetical protein